MANLNNIGFIEGRLTKNPVVFTNGDGSKKVMLTIAAKRNFKNAQTGKTDSDFIEVEGFVRAGVPGNGVYDMLSARDRVGIGYTVRTSRYQDKVTGKMVYKQVLHITDVALRETKAEAEAHRQQAAAAAAGFDGAPAALPVVSMDEAAISADEDGLL